MLSLYTGTRRLCYPMVKVSKNNLTIGKIVAETSDKLILCDDYNNLNYLDKSEYINKGFTYVPF